MHISNAPVRIIQVNTIRILRIIVQRAYKNEENEHTLHSFYPAVGPGFKIVETPTNGVFSPLNAQRIDNITLSIVDTVDFRGEFIIARLYLK